MNEWMNEYMKLNKTEDHEWMDGDKWIDEHDEHPLIKLYIQH